MLLVVLIGDIRQRLTACMSLFLINCSGIRIITSVFACVCVTLIKEHILSECNALKLLDGSLTRT
jgi:hypothetical protein